MYVCKCLFVNTQMHAQPVYCYCMLVFRAVHWYWLTSMCNFSKGILFLPFSILFRFKYIYIMLRPFSISPSNFDISIAVLLVLFTFRPSCCWASLDAAKRHKFIANIMIHLTYRKMEMADKGLYLTLFIQNVSVPYSTN